MRLSSGDYPGDPCVKPHSRMHCEESFLKNDIILNALGNTIQQIIVHYASFLIGIIAIPVPSYINRNNASFYIENFHPVLIFSNSDGGRSVWLGIYRGARSGAKARCGPQRDRS